MNMRMMERDAIDWGTADIRILFRKIFRPDIAGNAQHVGSHRH